MEVQGGNKYDLFIVLTYILWFKKYFSLLFISTIVLVTPFLKYYPYIQINGQLHIVGVEWQYQEGVGGWK